MCVSTSQIESNCWPWDWNEVDCHSSWGGFYMLMNIVTLHPDLVLKCTSNVLRWQYFFFPADFYFRKSSAAEWINYSELFRANVSTRQVEPKIQSWLHHNLSAEKYKHIYRPFSLINNQRHALLVVTRKHGRRTSLLCIVNKIFYFPSWYLQWSFITVTDLLIWKALSLGCCC